MDHDSFVFVIGGARSGKSDFAVEFGRRSGRPVTILATATAGDKDMRRRIERHRRDRPGDWSVVEEPLDIMEAVGSVAADDLLIVDCLTMWTANAVFAERADGAIVAEASALGAALAERRGTSLAVSNEVGLGIHPAEELGRRYRDLLGRVNRAVAAEAATTLFFVAGRAVALDDPWTLLDQPGSDQR